MTSQFGPVSAKHGTSFRLWAPAAQQILLEIDGRAALPLSRGADDWHEVVADVPAGTHYQFRLPGGDLVPDPASRYQPEGVHGPSMLVDESFAWQSKNWKGRPFEEAIFYEIHVGLAGGYSGVAAQLPALAELGITAIELMPLGEFPGTRNWGYDGVLPFAPNSDYGSREELKALIDRAHEFGLMMFLDVVYNHFGSDGNYLARYAPQFFMQNEVTPWGPAIDFGRPQVRRFFIENALYWLGEFRFDGLRLDAIHAVSHDDFLVDLAQEVRQTFPERHIHLVVENEDNDACLLEQSFDAQWNDDFHNVLHVLLTGESASYYRDFATAPADRLARCLADGFVYQGEPSINRNGATRGTPSAQLRPSAFVNFLQNHDQIGNRALGERLLCLAASPAVKAAAALLILCPSIPLLFMGEETGSATPFLFFTDFHDALADAVREGRRKEFAGFPAFADPQSREKIPDPNNCSTFERSRPQPDPAHGNEWWDYYRRLIEIRRREIVPYLAHTRAIGAKVLGDKSVTAEWRLSEERKLIIAVNLQLATVELELPRGRMIFGEPSSALPPFTTLAWIDGE